MSEEKRLYYTEIQKRNAWNLRKRSRYYQAQLDVSLLEPGSKNFNLLNDSCFILVAPFDIFGRGLYRYTFEGTCRECPDLKMDDGAVRVFINTSGTNKEEFSQEFLDFMEYITDTTDQTAAKAGSSRMACIHKWVKEVRQSGKMGLKYMQLWEEKEYIREGAYNEGLEMGQKRGHELGFEEGRKEGEKKLLRLICKELHRGKGVQELAEDFEESAETIERIIQLAMECEFDCDKIFDKLYMNQLKT